MVDLYRNFSEVRCRKTAGLPEKVDYLKRDWRQGAGGWLLDDIGNATALCVNLELERFRLQSQERILAL